jgi:transcriptional regulator with XRE-family HTH domain
MGLSQQDAADLIGVSYTTVGRKERGANIDQAYLEAAARAYACTPTDILERSPANQEAEGIEKIIADANVALELYLKRSIAAAREQSLIPHPAPSPRPQSKPKAPLHGSKLSQKPNWPKRP